MSVTGPDAQPTEPAEHSHGPVVAPVETLGASAKVSRAGRNLPAAIAVGCALGALVLVTLAFWKVLFLGVAVIAVCVGVWELVQGLRGVAISVPLVPLVLGTAGTMVAAYAVGETGLAMGFALSCALALWWRVSDRTVGVMGSVRDVLAAWLVAAYPGLLAGFACLMLREQDGAWRVLTFVALAVASDVGGYAAGVLAGRHPMAPTISPKKSWEGFAGSVLLCAVVGAVCVGWLLHGNPLFGVLAGVLAAPAATLGDLMESALKRDLGIKDMSNILPGHGGVMDRLDSVLVCAAVVWAVLAAWVPVVA